MEALIEGYRHFRETYLKQNRTLFQLLANGQSPQAMVICCCDSRIEPSLIFNARPGEIFTLRNIANLVPPYTPDASYHGASAAIEFAVSSLKVKDIIVMGHSGCGGVKALLEEGRQGEFLYPWMRIATEARENTIAAAAFDNRQQIQRRCEQENIRISLRNLRGYPWLAERIEKDGLSLHGWYFDIEQGLLYSIDHESAAFQAV